MGDPQTISWVPQSGGDRPKFAVHAGIDEGAKLFVARAHHDGALVPGKLHVGHSSIYIPYNMKEEPKDDYEVLIAPPASVSWVPGEGGSIPDNAIPGGYESNGETMYIGRAIHNGKVTIGKVHPSHGVCYVAYGGEELNFSEYEILVKNALGRMMNC